MNKMEIIKNELEKICESDFINQKSTKERNLEYLKYQLTNEMQKQTNNKFSDFIEIIVSARGCIVDINFLDKQTNRKGYLDELLQKYNLIPQMVSIEI